jgi:membrane-associated protein
VTAVLTALLMVLGPAGLLLLGAVVFAETGLLIGFFLPGDTLLFASGLLVASGALPFPLVVVIAATWVAAAAGDQVGYWIGGRVGHRLLAGARLRRISAKHLQAAHIFFERHGHKAVILARFVPLARTFTPVVAGAVTMPRRRFTAYNVAGGLLWTTTMCLAGRFLGTVPLIADHVELIAVGIDVLLLLLAISVPLLRRPLAAMLRRRHLSRREQHRSADEWSASA